MGNAFVGIVHPCKIYNILAIGAPVLYIGPTPSHITDLLPESEGVAAVARESFMIDEFLAKLEKQGALGITWKNDTGPEVLFHGHCHQKAFAKGAFRPHRDLPVE
jgi:hypothetical protein